MYDSLKKFIEDECIFRCPPGYFLKGIPDGKMYSWQFYLRRAIFDQECLSQIVDWLYRHHTRGTQYAAMESAGPPILAALLAHAKQKGVHLEGFAIRKEQKKYGLFNMIEGRFDPTKPVVILDDIANSKSTILRAKEVCENVGLNVIQAKTIVNKSKTDNTVDGLTLYSMFGIDQFKLTYEEYYRTIDPLEVEHFVQKYKGVLFQQTGPNTVKKL